MRKSNFELLRIVCAFLVLLLHYIPFRGDISPETFSNNTYNVIFSLELKSLGFVCVNCFILISGYFGIKWSLKSFLNYTFIILFWTVFSLLLTNEYVSLWGGVKKILGLYTVNWFVRAYTCLYMFAPLLNKFIENSSEKEFRHFLFVFYLVSTYMGWIFKTAPEFEQGLTFVSLSGLYLIGAYLKKYGTSYLFTFNKYIDLIIYFILGQIMVIISCITLSLGLSNSIYGYLSPFVLVQTVYLFLFFKKLNIQNKIINWFAASAFAVFLIHSNMYFKKICIYIVENYELHFLYVLIFFISIYLTASIIDRVRMFLFNIIYSILPLKK